MKKYFILVIILLLLVSGCKDKNDANKIDKNATGSLICTKKNKDDDGFNSREEITVNYQNGKVISILQSSTQEVEDSVRDTVYNVSLEFAKSMSKASGIDITIEKEGKNVIKTISKVDYTKVKVEELHDLFGEDFDASFYESDNLELEAYQKKNLSEYECK